MRGRLTTMVECETDDGYHFLAGRLGDMPRDPSAPRRNDRRWPPEMGADDGDPMRAEDKRSGAQRKGWRRRQREREGVESLGGTEL